MTTETTTETPAELDLHLRKLCDLMVERAAALMVEGGAPVPMVLDRLLTYAAAQACSIEGTHNTATVFRTLADTIEGGMFDQFDAEKRGRH